MIATLFEVLFAAALLVGVLNREKLIAFERKIADAFDLVFCSLPAILAIVKNNVRIAAKATSMAIKATIVIIREGSFDVGE